jgi:hypothetical protein
MQKAETRPLSLNLYKNQSKTDQNLNVRSEPLKLLQESIEKTVKDVGIGNYFLNRTPIAREIRAIIDKRMQEDCINKKLLHIKEKNYWP